MGGALGDPAMTTSGASYSVVFLSNLGIPKAKFPAGGIDGSVITGTGKTSYVGGGCIAKSRDGGKTFAHFQCVQNTDPVADASDATLGHFYEWRQHGIVTIGRGLRRIRRCCHLAD